MPLSAPIKLQGVIAATATQADIDRIKKWLEANGGAMTTSGRRSFSAQMTDEAFQRAFGAAPPHTSAGFAASVSSATEVSVPETLRDVVELITLVPRQARL
jgi:hypothetical protein